MNASQPRESPAFRRGEEVKAANDGFTLFTDGVPGRLLERPVNVLRLSLHPDGLAARIVNLASWRADLLARLRRRAVPGTDPHLRQPALTCTPVILGGPDSPAVAGLAIKCFLPARQTGPAGHPLTGR